MDDLIGFLWIVLFVGIALGSRAIKAAREKAQREQQRQAKRPSAGGAQRATPVSAADAELREFLQKVTGAVPQRPTTTRPRPSRPVSRGPARAPARDVSGDIERALGGTAAARGDLGAALPSEEKRAAARAAQPRRTPKPPRPSHAPKRAAARRAKHPARKPAARPTTTRRLVPDAPPAKPAAPAREAAPTQPSAVSPALSTLSELQRAIVMAEILGKPTALKQPREF